MSRHIAVVEPQMEEVFHAPFNAALLHTVALAYPAAPLSFRAFPEHLRIVRSILQQHAAELLDRIEWRTAPLPPTNSLLSRWRHSSRAIRDILSPHEQVVFCSISRMQLLQLKRAMRPGDVVRAVLHGDLDSIEQPPSESFPLSLLSLPRVIQWPRPAGLRYILLGQSIAENVPPDFRGPLGPVGIIDHPYHFPPLQPATSSPLAFGIFGNTGDGRMLVDIARAVKAANPAVNFHLVGFLADQAAVERLSPFVEGATDKPIPRETFVQRAEGITHTLWFAPPSHFRLRASGTFFDALAYAKPLVYTANAYIDSYFDHEPAIGVRCLTATDIPSAILTLAEHHNPQTYAAAQAAMLRLRTRFTPQEQAKILPSALELD